jgi:NAD(P)-dependent dehydrogenase (short-subunit alcohol dehydrogenase family)
MTSLSGKTPLVTCASRAIGRASALALTAAGVQVLIVGRPCPRGIRVNLPAACGSCGGERPKGAGPTESYRDLRDSHLYL